MQKLIASAVGFLCLQMVVLSAQVGGQPPASACKPGDFVVLGSPNDFGPKKDSQFKVLIDQRFDGGFLTKETIWIPVIEQAIPKWNGIPGSTWNFEIEGVTEEEASGEDGKTTIAGCGSLFTCPEEPPELPEGDPPPDIPLTAQQTVLAVTVIFSDLSPESSIADADIFFNPEVPFQTNPNDTQYDFETVLLHELGHALGLDHSDNCVVGPTVMESELGFGERKRDLRASETEGAKFLYPDGSSPAIRIFEQDAVVGFQAAEGGPNPFSQAVPIFGHQGGRWIASSSAAWLQIEPPTGRFLLDGEVNVFPDVAGLAVGNYQATASIELEGFSGPSATVQVNLEVLADVPAGVEPKLTQTGIVNAANMLSQALAPGSLFALFGSQLSASTEQASFSSQLPTRLGGAEVFVNAVRAPLLYASPTQINGQVPVETPVGRGGIIVRTDLSQTGSIPIDFIATAPELFLINGDQAVVLNEDFTLNSPDNPAAQGSEISVLFTGQGPVSPPVLSGRPAPLSPRAEVTSDAKAEIGGLEVEILFLGLTPGWFGVGEANLAVPVGLTGLLPVRLTIGGKRSGSGLVSVQ